ncbi:DUF960 domain-containing protein [Macrococcoides bohemicum]|uniref:DUF960 domain-containing protein n=1 Tax=Macrococcoides bohemicum TaxID=1903056 RepID=A0A4V3B1W9_9STAP|nr:DUF960 family protein [Macrococcus bohemicus]QRN48615.1 hypothetical protein HT586_00185 [Macrococcus bohemicus]QYA42412.1 DUF960 domain-containing protein [Macrococcus bohemicus]TDL38258.1 hypothetical protein EVU91_04950 [Macrococcus bohemicus]
MKKFTTKTINHLVPKNVQSTLFSLVEKREIEYSRLFNKKPDYLSVFSLKILPNEIKIIFTQEDPEFNQIMTIKNSEYFAIDKIYIFRDDKSDDSFLTMLTPEEY